MKFLMKYLCFSFCLLIGTACFGQLSLSSGADGEALASMLTGGGVTITNISLNCPSGSSGTFSNGNTTNIGLDDGILLTSGCATDAIGPNDAANKTCQTGGPNDPDLAALTTASTFDRCVLEFDLESIGDFVTFRYVFASEEYNEYTCTRFNDVFGFLVTGPNPDPSQPAYNNFNIARVPGTSHPVTINYVNNGKVGSSGGNISNCSGANGSLGFSGFFVNNPESPTTTIQYDGFTTVLTASIELVPCQTYHFKLGVADVTDRAYDSGVFIESGSFTSNEILASGSQTPPSCPGACDGEIQLTAAGGEPPYAYSWSNASSASTIDGLCAGNYRVTITDDIGCTEELNFNLPDGTDDAPPAITCPDPISTENETGDCGASIDFEATATDDCTDPVPITYSRAPGSFFEVGKHLVECRATDEAGRSSSCIFQISVTDEEEPAITCPARIDLDCSLSPDPANTGSPEVSDNCELASLEFSDDATAGSCAAESTIVRTWQAEDIHGNSASCQQTIEIVDLRPPMMTCPVDITVACDIEPETATGNPKVTDNCDPRPALEHTDRVVEGDCDWNCQIERSWTATDECGNTSNCVQRIEIDLTPLLEEALAADLDTDGVTDTLIMGVTQTTLSIFPGSGNCIPGWMPSSGTVPDGLSPAANEVVGADCLPGTNPVDADGKINNPLFAESLKLALALRLDEGLGSTKLDELDCDISPIVLQALAPNPDLTELMRVTNIALGNLALVPHRNELLAALACINGPIDLCGEE